jgi:hypothetical protein
MTLQDPSPPEMPSTDAMILLEEYHALRDEILQRAQS